MATLFFSYSHADEALRDELEKHLSMLKRQGVIETWHDRRIGAGEELDHSINRHVESGDIILLLVSSDFLASSYCYDREMGRAMERQERGSATVIPVILRPCDWHSAPFGKLMATPPDGKPITKWADRDEAFLAVTQAIKEAAAARTAPGQTSPTIVAATAMASSQSFGSTAGPRSSNLRLAKQFSDRDRDCFKVESFEYIARFFENSLGELAQRNPGIEGDFRRIDSNRFTAVIYRDGSSVARCTVFIGSGYMSSGIAYLANETTESNSYNESLSVDADDHALYLRSMGMAAMARSHGDTPKLTQEGAAELYWGMLIEPLQRSRER